jgi:hypothetical protein
MESRLLTWGVTRSRTKGTQMIRKRISSAAVVLAIGYVGFRAG